MSTHVPGTQGPVPSVADDLRPRSLWGSIQARIISGLLLALPIGITFWIIYWIYITFHHYVLDPIAWGVRALMGEEMVAALPAWWDWFVAPLIAIILMLLFLYVLGLFVRSRLYRMLNWVLLHVPVVTTIYQAINNLFAALEQQRRVSSQFNRVVLVEFPQPGMRSLGLVTNTLRDASTGKAILCVCVLTGVMPPTGFTLLVPEESVTDLDWSMNQMLQAILSGGLSAPGTVDYYGQAQGTGHAGAIQGSGDRG